ncbi:MAG: P-II family nitrogen regulator [Verrucomicrobiota bacterium]|jgi:nitrogen regulatory protein P-II 1
MKKTDAVIKPFRLAEVKAALAALGIEGMTVLEAKGFERQKGLLELHRGREYTADSLPRLRLDIILEDSQVDGAVQAIVASARTGRIGDGRVCVSTLDEVVRIRAEDNGGRAP